MKIQKISIDLMRPGKFQPRTIFEESSIKELAASIKEEGLLQPITVRPIKDEDDPECKYEIVAGERRWRAFKLLKELEIPCLVRDMDDKKTAVLALTENVQRSNLSPLEEAFAVKKMTELTGMTLKEVSKKLGKKEATLSRTLKLLNLNSEVAGLLRLKKLDYSKAVSLASLPRSKQSFAADVVLTRNLNLRQTSFLVSNLLKEKAKSKAVPYTKKIEAPIYEPKGKRPKISELFDDSKTKSLIAEIDESDLDESVKQFLRTAACRHTSFHYGRIAEFYCHASPELQNLMENSALVLIDFDKALENGFIKMTKEIREQFMKDMKVKPKSEDDCDE